MDGVRLCTGSRAHRVATKVRGGADADAWGRDRCSACIFSVAKRGDFECHNGLLASLEKHGALINWVEGRGVVINRVAGNGASINWVDSKGSCPKDLATEGGFLVNGFVGAFPNVGDKGGLRVVPSAAFIAWGSVLEEMGCWVDRVWRFGLGPTWRCRFGLNSVLVLWGNLPAGSVSLAGPQDLGEGRGGPDVTSGCNFGNVEHYQMLDLGGTLTVQSSTVVMGGPVRRPL